MSGKRKLGPVRILADDVSNKIAAGEVVERPGSVVKELVENALDAQATRITVRVVGAGRRLIEVADNGTGMGEQDAMLAIERHATSKIRKAEDLDNITTLGFRGEALASIASVSRFELVTRRERDESATRIQIDGGVLREVSQVGAPVGTRITVNRLYFNTPVRAKFLKGVTTELSHCIDTVQRHALANPGVGFQFLHNEKLIMDIPEMAALRERAALIWGLNFVQDMTPLSGEYGGLKLDGLIGTPALTRSSRSHQFFFMNARPVVNRSIQFGFEEAYRGLLTVGRRPVGIVMLSTHPRFVDVNIHPAKREIRFRDERAAREAVRVIVRQSMDALSAGGAAVEESEPLQEEYVTQETLPQEEPVETKAVEPVALEQAVGAPDPKNVIDAATAFDTGAQPEPTEKAASKDSSSEAAASVAAESPMDKGRKQDLVHQTEFTVSNMGTVEPGAVFQPVDDLAGVPIQVFDTYLIVPQEDRLLIIDQHALHERLNYDSLVEDLSDSEYAAQQLAVPILVDVPPAHSRLIESNIELFAKLGIEIEPFGGGTFQVTGICHIYDESLITDAIYQILDQLAQGDLFDREDFMADFLRLATEACKASVKAGDRLSTEEKRRLLEGFHRMRPPYTCPHGRPIITELTLHQMEKSFRRRQ